MKDCFKVGQKVRITGASRLGHYIKIGSIGEITGSDALWFYVLGINRDTGSSIMQCIHSDDLKIEKEDEFDKLYNRLL